MRGLACGVPVQEIRGGVPCGDGVPCWVACGQCGCLARRPGRWGAVDHLLLGCGGCEGVPIGHGTTAVQPRWGCSKGAPLQLLPSPWLQPKPPWPLWLQVLKRAYHAFKGPELCHSDVVKCIVVTDTGKIMTGG